MRGFTTRASRLTTYLVAVTMLLVAVIWSFFMERRIFYDDYTLFNPAYIAANYGLISYPAHTQYYWMVVHPPTQYLMMAALIKIGFSSPYAEAIPPFVLIVIAVVLVLTGKFSDEVKVSLFFGLIAGSLLPWVAVIRGLDQGFSIGLGATRPDLDVAFAFFAGLIGLESGRLDNWDPKKLFLGSLLLTYASVLHYSAMIAWTGICPYMFWVARENREGLLFSFKGTGRKAVLAILSGALLVGIPYMLMWFIPNFHHIIDWINQPGQEPFGGVAAAVRAHIRNYTSMYSFFDGVSRLIFFPVGFEIPIVLFSTPVLFCRRDTRGIAVSSLPCLLFLLLLIQRKIQLGFGYFYPELILCATAFALLVFLSAKSIFESIRLPRNLHALVTPVLAVVLMILLFSGSGWIYGVDVSISPRLDEMAIARAAGKEILGPKAIVGEEIGENYIYGEAYWYMINPYVLWDKIGNLNLTQFFSKSDAISLDSWGNDVTANEYNESIASWYANRVLNVRGFYFSTRHSPVLDYLLLSVSLYPVIGFGLLGNWTVMRFNQQIAGDYMFVAADCSAADFPLLQPTGLTKAILTDLGVPALFSNAYPLPLASSGVQREIVTFISASRSYFPERALVSSKCSIRDEISLGANFMSAQELLNALTDDRPIQFFASIGEALAARDHISNGTFNDNFSTDVYGTAPSSWKVYEAPRTQVGVTSCVNEKKCALITDNDSLGYAEMSVSPIEVLGDVCSVEFDLLAEQTTQPLNFYGNSIPSGKGIGIELAMRENGMISYFDGLSWNDFFRYRSGTWYDFMITRMGDQTYDVYINGSLVLRNAEKIQLGPIIGVMFQTYPGAQVGAWYLSWVKVSYEQGTSAIGTPPPLPYQFVAYSLEFLIGAFTILLLLANKRRRRITNLTIS